MSVTNNTPIVTYVADGLKTSFALTFEVEGKDNIKVSANNLLVSKNDYNYSSTNNSINFYQPVVSGTEIKLERNTDLERSEDYTAFGNSFRPETLNYDFDRIWRALQEKGVQNSEALASLINTLQTLSERDRTILDAVQDQALADIKQDTGVADLILAEAEARKKSDEAYNLLAALEAGQTLPELKSYVDNILGIQNPNLLTGITSRLIVDHETGETVKQSFENQAEFNDIVKSEQINLLNFYGKKTDDFGVAVELAHQEALKAKVRTIFIPSGNYTAKTSADLNLTSPLELKFSSNVVVYAVNEINVFNINLSHHFLAVNAESTMFIPSWDTSVGESSVFKLLSNTLGKSTSINGIYSSDNNGLRFKNAINSRGLNYSLIKDCLFQAIDPIVNASDHNGNGHSMGSIVKDCYLHAHDLEGIPVTLINNGSLACEGWTFEGGEYFGDTAIKVINNLSSSNYLSPLLRVSNVHMNCNQFAKLDGVGRVQFVGCDLQARVLANNPHTGLFELTGVQVFSLGSGTTISQAPTTGLTPQDSISVLSFKKSSKGQVSAFASVDGAILWLYQNAPLVRFETEDCYVGKVNIGVLNTDAFTAAMSTLDYSHKISLPENTKLSNSLGTVGVSVSDSATFDVTTGVLILQKAPAIGNVYQIYSSIVPSGSTIKQIKTEGSLGKNFKVIIEASNVTLTHSSALYTPSQATIKLLYGATLDCFNYNGDITRVMQVSANTSLISTASVPTATSSEGLHGQKIFNAGFVYEYVYGTGWIKYAAATF